MNSINVIHPYKCEGMWVFDDERVGLIQEPFVSGADRIIDEIVADIPNAKDGFTLIFAATPFPGYRVKLDWLREEYAGNWYRYGLLGIEGWLCPAMFKYFEKAPQHLYVQCNAKQ